MYNMMERSGNVTTAQVDVQHPHNILILIEINNTSHLNEILILYVVE